MRVQAVSGPGYLEPATRLLQRVRLADPTAGLWEAADLQWWWRTPRSSDSVEQTFWYDAADEPVAATVFTDWARTWGCDLIVVPHRAEDLLPTMWDLALRRMDEMSIRDVEILARDDDGPLIDLVTAAGFATTGERGAETWLDADRRPAVSELAAGYRLRDRSDTAARPHHMVKRSGPEVAARLAETSLYRRDLDLFIESADGAVAAYGMFWFDPVTRVGLVEPMRTETPHEGRGLGRHLLHSGLGRLAALGASRLKVSYEIGNDRAERLYLGAGFTSESTSAVYARRR